MNHVVQTTANTLNTKPMAAAMLRSRLRLQISTITKCVFDLLLVFFASLASAQTMTGTVFHDTVGSLLAGGAKAAANNTGIGSFSVRLFDVAVDASIKATAALRRQTYASAATGHSGAAGGATAFARCTWPLAAPAACP